MIKIIILIAVTSFGVASNEYDIDLNYSKLEHSWRGISVADYTTDLNGVGLTYWNDNGLGVRFAYSKGRDMYTAGRYESYVIKLKYIASLELLYRYNIISNLYLIVGIGTNKTPVPIYSIKENYYRNDSDNDEGYILGLQYKLSKNTSIGWRFTNYSRIKKGVNDEWTKAHSINLAYTF